MAARMRHLNTVDAWQTRTRRPQPCLSIPQISLQLSLQSWRCCRCTLPLHTAKGGSALSGYWLCAGSSGCTRQAGQASVHAGHRECSRRPYSDGASAARATAVDRRRHHHFALGRPQHGVHGHRVRHGGSHGGDGLGDSGWDHVRDGRHVGGNLCEPRAELVPPRDSHAAGSQEGRL